MTKEQYIYMRDKGNFNIVYEYYKEKFNPEIHIPFLGIMELPQLLLAAGGDINKIFEKCCKYYDEKFNITLLLDKNGNLIKFL